MIDEAIDCFLLDGKFSENNILKECGKAYAVGGSIKSMLGIRVVGRTCFRKVTLILVLRKLGLTRFGLILSNGCLLLSLGAENPLGEGT